MKLGLVQSNILWEDKKENMRLARKWAKRANEAGVKLLLFPEMSFTGFSMDVGKIGETKGETIAFLKELAREYQMHVGAGWSELTGEKGKNHYTIVNASGEVVLDYVKMHPFSYSGEDRYYEAGDHYEVVTLEDTTLSVFICYDLRFPRNFWLAAEKAHLIIVPANWPKRRIEQWKTLLKARAIENQVYIAAINCVGDVGSIEYSGASCFVHPKGEMLAIAEDQEELIVIDWEDDVDKLREKFPVHADRRAEERDVTCQE